MLMQVSKVTKNKKMRKGRQMSRPFFVCLLRNLSFLRLKKGDVFCDAVR